MIGSLGCRLVLGPPALLVHGCLDISIAYESLDIRPMDILLTILRCSSSIAHVIGSLAFPCCLGLLACPCALGPLACTCAFALDLLLAHVPVDLIANGLFDIAGTCEPLSILVVNCVLGHCRFMDIVLAIWCSEQCPCLHLVDF